MTKRLIIRPRNRKPTPVADPIWDQPLLQRRETYEAGNELLPELPLIGRFVLHRAVPGALHWSNHPAEYELQLQEDGYQAFLLDDAKQSVVVRGGQALLIRPGQMHAGASETLQPGRWSWLRIRITPGRSSSVTPSLPGLDPRQSAHLLRGLASTPQPVFRYSPSLLDCFNRLISEHRYPTDESPLVARSILHELIAWVLRDIRNDSRRGTTENAQHSPPVAKALLWLSQHIDEGVSVSDLAAAAGSSESYFRRRFHAETGLSPREYVAHYRLQESKRMLLSTHHSITDIAMRLGFSTSAYFTSVFRRNTGQTPSQFRTEAAAEPSSQPAAGQPAAGQISTKRASARASSRATSHLRRSDQELA
jgi:AraC-like DNA-binding protein